MSWSLWSRWVDHPPGCCHVTLWQGPKAHWRATNYNSAQDNLHPQEPAPSRTVPGPGAPAVLTYKGNPPKPPLPCGIVEADAAKASGCVLGPHPSTTYLRSNTGAGSWLPFLDVRVGLIFRRQLSEARLNVKITKIQLDMASYSILPPKFELQQALDTWHYWLCALATS